MVRRPPARTLAFGAAIGFLTLFWLAGQAATLRWQVRHLVTHTPEVVDAAGRPPR